MDGVRITHIGGPTVLIEVEGWRILSDPTFDAPGRRYGFGWGTSSRKLAGPAISVADLGPIDVVLVSTTTTRDNLDDAGRALLPSAGVVVTTTAGAGRLGGTARGLDPWATTMLDAPGMPSIEVTATPCRHGPPLSRPSSATSPASPCAGRDRSTACSGSRVTPCSTTASGRSPSDSRSTPRSCTWGRPLPDHRTDPLQHDERRSDRVDATDPAPRGGAGPLRGLVALLRGSRRVDARSPPRPTTSGGCSGCCRPRRLPLEDGEVPSRGPRTSAVHEFHVLSRGRSCG